MIWFLKILKYDIIKIRNCKILTLDVLTSGVTYSWEMYKNSIFAKYNSSMQFEHAVSAFDKIPASY